jgi:hypothetical protein
VDLIEDVENLLRHHQHPEGDTVTDQTVEETPAQGESIAEEAEDHVKQIIAWGQRFLTQGLPALKTKAEAEVTELKAKVAELEASPAVKLLENLLPALAQAVLKIMGEVVAAIGTAVSDVTGPETPAEPDAPAEPPADGEQPQ